MDLLNGNFALPRRRSFVRRGKGLSPPPQRGRHKSFTINFKGQRKAGTVHRQCKSLVLSLFRWQACGFRRVILDIDIWCAASLMLKRYGERR
jgi:hypothetical protein